MIRVGLIGFFGWGNFGDELFVTAHQQNLAGVAEVRTLPDMTEKPYFSRPVEDVVESVDAIVIGGGDLLIPWQLSGLYWRPEFLRKPVFVVGVGVPTWQKHNPGVLEHYRKFLSDPNVKLVMARDPESADWIKDKIKPDREVEWSPDLVCALSLPASRGKAKDQGRRLGLILRQRRGEDDFVQVRRLVDRGRELGYSPVHIVLGNKATGRKDFEIAQRVAGSDEEIVYSENLDAMCQAIASCDMIASMKFHGTVVATMYGVPSIVLSPTDKSRNFIRLIERPDLLSSFSKEDLPERLPSFPVPIPSHTRRFLRTRSRAGYQKLREALTSLTA